MSSRAPHWSRAFALLLPLCLSLTACSKGDNPAGPTDDDDPLPGSITVTAAGGVFPLRGDRVELEIPPGLFTAETTIAYAALPDDDAHPGFFSGTGIDFGAAGVELPGQVILRIRFQVDDLPEGMAGQSLDICRLMGGQWQLQGATSHSDGTGMAMELHSQVLGTHALVATLSETEVCAGALNELVTTMAELESYRGCRAIPLGLRIQGPAITSLEPLSSLEQIGSLELNSVINLPSLTGLDNLRRATSVSFHFTMADFDFGVLDNLQVCNNLALYGCIGLTRLATAATIEDLGTFIVSGCHQLETVALPNVRRIGSLAITNNWRIESAAFAAPTAVYRSFTASADTALVALTGLELEPTLTESFAIDRCTHLTTLPDCSDLVTITGDLHIERADALTDLAFLAGLQTVGGGIYIGLNDKLETLAGLENLSSAAGGLTLSHNPALETLGHLQSLNQIGGSLLVLECDALRSLAGLGGLDVSGDITISGNSALVSVAGLGGSVSGIFAVEHNPALTSFAGLSLSHAGTALYVFDNTALTSLGGLSVLHGYANLEIAANPGLTDLTGLADLIGLTSVTIQLNHGLTDLHGLESLTEVISLTIDNNHNIANLHGLGNLHRVDGTLDIIGNSLLLHAHGLEALTSVGSLVVRFNANMQDLAGLEHLTRLGWTQQESGTLRITDQIHFENLEPLYGLLPDPGTGKVIPGDCVLTGNTGMGTSGAWAFIDAIGGELMVGGEIVIEHQ